MQQLHRVLQKIWGDIASPLSLSLRQSLRDVGLEGTLRTLPSVDPRSYSDPFAYLKDAQAVAIVKKLQLPSADTAEKRLQAAQAKFFSSEKQCEQTNVFISRLVRGMADDDLDVALFNFLQKWRSLIARTLGPIPNRLRVEVSGGSTLSDAGVLTTLPDKLSSQPTCYADCVDIHRHTVDGMYSAARRWNPEIVKANRFFTVPKSIDEDRGCAVEASEAIRLQLGIGSVIRERYGKRYNIVLNEAQALHRQLACEGSWWNENIGLSFATIDLSSASDTIARELVRAILPCDWWLLLNSCRAHFTEIEGKRYYSAKFSSMGNGFTFELETLIFRTLLEALGCGEHAWCYGDDIIVESKHFITVCNALKVWGFTPNPKKTFGEGPFRESCGGDYFSGYDVRPAYMKEPPMAPHQWIALHNSLKAVKHLRFPSALRYIVEQIPMQYRVSGPESLGNLVLWDDKAVPYTRVAPCGTKIPYWRVYAPVQYRKALHGNFPSEVISDCALMGSGTKVSPRDTVTGYRVKRVNAYGLGQPFSYGGEPRSYKWPLALIEALSKRTMS